MAESDKYCTCVGRLARDVSFSGSLRSALVIGALQLLPRSAGMPCAPANRRPSGPAIFLSQTRPAVYPLGRMREAHGAGRDTEAVNKRSKSLALTPFS